MEDKTELIPTPAYMPIFRKAFDQGGDTEITISISGEDHTLTFDMHETDTYPFVRMVRIDSKYNTEYVVDDPRPYIFENFIYMMQALDINSLVIHYKNNATYIIIGVGKHTETSERGVFYRSVDDNKLYFRPLGMFIEPVLFNGEYVPRFKIKSDI